MDKIIPAHILTATILTWNEEENIARTLSKLQWLEKVVIIDSGSTDSTIALINTFNNTEVHGRKFDTHGAQWNHSLNFCGSEWVLSMDADYILTDAFIQEIQEKIETSDADAYYANFDFMIFGRALKGNNTTPRAVLFKKALCAYYDDGHTQRLHINGSTGSFTNKIVHDDRKPLSRWLQNQGNYSEKEVAMLLRRPNADLPRTGRLRKMKIVAPVFIFFYCLLYKRMIFNGWRGWHYTLQRTIAEMLVSLRLTEAQYLDKKDGDKSQ